MARKSLSFHWTWTEVGRGKGSVLWTSGSYCCFPPLQRKIKTMVYVSCVGFCGTKIVRCFDFQSFKKLKSGGGTETDAGSFLLKINADPFITSTLTSAVALRFGHVWIYIPQQRCHRKPVTQAALISLFFMLRAAIAFICAAVIVILLLLNIFLCVIILCCFTDQPALLHLHLIPQFIISVVMELCNFESW